MTRRSLPAIALLALAASALSCGGREPGTLPPDDGGTGDGRALPLAVGASWTYSVTEVATGAHTDKTSVVEAFEDVGGRKAGTMAFRIRTQETGGPTVSWQELREDGVYRLREDDFRSDGSKKAEDWYEPAKLRVDDSPAHTMVGATWVDRYTEVHVPDTGASTSTPKVETWTVEAVAERLTVPAGTFTTLRVHRLGKSDKTYWFARGVGKIREKGDRIEDLASYTLPGGAGP